MKILNRYQGQVRMDKRFFWVYGISLWIASAVFSLVVDWLVK